MRTVQAANQHTGGNQAVAPTAAVDPSATDDELEWGEAIDPEEAIMLNGRGPDDLDLGEIL